MNTTKKILVGCFIALFGAAVFAGGPRPPEPREHHHDKGESGLELAAGIVGLIRWAVSPVPPAVVQPPVVVQPPPPPTPWHRHQNPPFRRGRF